jgi:nicotinamidase-related amidase
LLAPKQHPNLLHPDTTILVVVDMQESLLRAIHERERVLKNVRTLIQGATTLRLPIISTTQSAEKLGDINPEIKSLLPPLLPPFDKLTFSCYANPAFQSEIRRSGRKQVLLCGLESHICVSQTAHDLVAAGFQVHAVADAISARTESNWRVGLDKMRQGGALLASVESALYELLHEAGTPEFRAILALVK